ncbi:hypothetical protein J0X15_15840 [Roseibium sp. CAU 1637]|uniref:Uncharacterized protein n=1 Tax=Roseibium limicola TaxID=2816037 RepID=A0A939J6B9_9HYPH|nr:hypothetical protein [Roseibium limicola]MBO0346700.1 hypothetical protein [Roseibium limicola]
MQKEEFKHPHKRGFEALKAVSGMTATDLTDAINERLSRRGDTRRYSVSTVRKYASPGFDGKPSDALLDVTRDAAINRIMLSLAIAESIMINGETRAERDMRLSREREIERILRLDEEQIDIGDAIEAAA